MCVIIYKPAGVKLPNWDILDKAQARNNDGCGFCSPNINYKGLSYASFKKKIKLVGENDPVLIHFRFATNGSVKRSNCHPFFDKGTETYFMHNGILSVRSYNDMTDSECAFDSYLKPVLASGIDSYQLEFVVQRIIGGSKFAFMQGDKVKLFGDYVSYDDCYYSNLRFL